MKFNLLDVISPSWRDIIGAGEGNLIGIIILLIIVLLISGFLVSFFVIRKAGKNKGTEAFTQEDNGRDTHN